MKKTAYLDEATTSWPKDERTLAALVEGADMKGSSARGLSQGPDRAVLHARSTVASYFGVEDADRIVFTPGATFALNLVLKGTLEQGDTVLTSRSEHNSVARPLAQLAEQGVNVEFMPCDEFGRVGVAGVEAYLAEHEVQAIVCQHGSNVTGLLQPVEDLCALGTRFGVPVIIDGAQVGGHVPVDLAVMKPAAWICSGHKGLRGVKGVGVMYLREGFEPKPLVTGGTGAGDETLEGIDALSLYESGTQPLPAILALAAAIEAAPPIEEIVQKEAALTEIMLEGLRAIDDMYIVGDAMGAASIDAVGAYESARVTPQGVSRLPLVSITSKKYTPDELAFLLEKKYGIATRAGMQCAPLLHKHLGTYEQGGAVRLSISYCTPRADVDYALRALREIFER